MKNVINWKTMSRSGVKLGSAFSSLVTLPAMAELQVRPGQADLTDLAAAMSELIVRSATRVASIVIWAIRLRKNEKKKMAGTDSDTPSRVIKSAVEMPSATL